MERSSRDAKMTTLREELRDTLNPWLADTVLEIIEKHGYISKAEIEKRIDILIQHEEETLKRNIGNEGKIAAQASKNTLLLVKKELLLK